MLKKYLAESRFISLERVLPLVVPGMIVFPILVVVLIFFAMANSAIDTMAIDKLKQASHQVIVETEAFFDVAAYTTSINVELFRQLNHDPVSLNRFEAITGREMERYPHFSLIYYGDEQGNHWLHKREYNGFRHVRVIKRHNDSPESRQLVNRAVAMGGEPGTDTKQLTDLLAPILTTTWYERSSQGGLVATEVDPVKAYDPRLRPWYEGASGDKDRHWTNVYAWEEKFQGHTGYQVGITISAAVMEEGKRLGVAAIDITLNTISDFLGRLKVSPGSQAFIFDNKGLAVGLPDFNQVLATGNSSSRNGMADIADSSIKDAFAAYHPNLDGKTAMASTEQVIHFQSAGEPFMGHMEPFKPELGLNWTIGVIAPERDFKNEARNMLWGAMLAAIFLAMFLALVGRWISASMTVPIHQLVGQVHQLLVLDLTESDAVPTRYKELHLLSMAFSSMRGILRSILTDLKHKVTDLENTSGVLTNTSVTMLQGSQSSRDIIAVVGGLTSEVSENMGGIAGLIESMDDMLKSVVVEMNTMSANMATIAAAAEESSANLGNVARSSEMVSNRIDQVGESVQESSGNLSHAAKSMEAITRTMQQVREQCQQALLETEQGRRLVTQGTDTIETLGQTMTQVQSVVSVINDIAEQTNMLALNATIEAAGAGEAGRGFAVVATEVKDLSQKTSLSTDKISDTMSNVQEATSSVVRTSQAIAQRIIQLSRVNHNILNSVGIQADAVNEIDAAMNLIAQEAVTVAHKMDASTESIHDLSRSVGEISLAIDEVTKSVVNASSGVERMGPLVEQTTEGTWDIFVKVGAAAQSSININNQMVNVDQAAHTIHDLSLEIRQGADQLGSIAQDLKKTISEFKL